MNNKIIFLVKKFNQETTKRNYKFLNNNIFIYDVNNIDYKKIKFPSFFIFVNNDLKIYNNEFINKFKIVENIYILNKYNINKNSIEVPDYLNWCVNDYNNVNVFVNNNIFNFNDISSFLVKISNLKELKLFIDNPEDFLFIKIKENLNNIKYFEYVWYSSTPIEFYNFDYRLDEFIKRSLFIINNINDNLIINSYLTYATKQLFIFLKLNKFKFRNKKQLNKIKEFFKNNLTPDYLLFILNLIKRNIDKKMMIVFFFCKRLLFFRIYNIYSSIINLLDRFIFLKNFLLFIFFPFTILFFLKWTFIYYYQLIIIKRTNKKK